MAVTEIETRQQRKYPVTQLFMNRKKVKQKGLNHVWLGHIKTSKAVFHGGVEMGKKIPINVLKSFSDYFLQFAKEHKIK